MKIYVPLIIFELNEEEAEIADVILNGFYNYEDAKMIYPHAEVLEIEVSKENIQDN